MFATPKASKERHKEVYEICHNAIKYSPSGKYSESTMKEFCRIVNEYEKCDEEEEKERRKEIYEICHDAINHSPSGMYSESTMKEFYRIVKKYEHGQYLKWEQSMRENNVQNGKNINE
jgi:predicted oxidoreductase (fatty acid repression mutant protein)